MTKEPKKTEAQSSEKPIIELTPAAVAKIKEMRTKEGKEDSGLRIGVVTGGCAGMSYDLRFQRSAYANDIVLRQEGLDIYVNEESVPFLKGAKIDYIDSLKESGFKYINPNAHSSCGCGFSFS